MSRTIPTADFASLVYGSSGVPLDDPAETFHESSRLYPSLAPARLDVLLELSRGGELARTVARSARTHDHRPSVELPADRRLRGGLEAAIHRRRSTKAEVARPLCIGELATLLVSCYAASSGRGPVLPRPVPSAGALYPLELYVVALGVNGLDRGVYHFQPFRRCLSLLGPFVWGELRAALVDGTVLDHAAALIVITAVFWRARFKYGLRGYRFALLEAGHVGQSVALAAASLDLPALPLGGFYDRQIDALVGADGLDEAAVYAIVVGGAR
jgi:SagB-type dehydrogenase family enzyme